MNVNVGERSLIFVVMFVVEKEIPSTLMCDEGGLKWVG